MKKFVLFLLVSLYISSAFTQNINLDSLLEVVKNPKVDRSKAYKELYRTLKKTNRDSIKTLYLEPGYQEAIKHNNKMELGAILNYLGGYYKKKSELDTALVLYNKALEVRLEIPDSTGISKVYNNLGGLYLEKSLYRKAVENIQKALIYKLALEDKKGAGISYNALGNIYSKWGKKKIAIENFQLALKMFEEAKMPNGVASCYNNIGLTYQNLANGSDTTLLNESLKYFNKSLSINKEINDIWSAAGNNSNIANIYSAKAEQYRILSKNTSSEKDSILNKNISNKYFDLAITHSEESANSREQLNDLQGVAASYIGMGAIYINMDPPSNGKKSLDYFKKALEIGLKIEDQYLSAVCYAYLGKAYTQVKQYKLALKSTEEARLIAKKNGLQTILTDIFETFSEAYDSLGNYEKAYVTYKKFHNYYVASSNRETKQIIADMQTKYETDQKEAQNELLKKESEKQQLKSRQQMLIIYGFIGVFVIIIFFSFVVYRQFKQIRANNIALEEQKAKIEEANEELYQQNEEISAQRDEIQFQKDHIEEIHKEVSDSIHYAERIQKAILPQVKDIEGKITDRFTLFKPKDIVSGDFYWQKHLKRSKMFVATAADCTGHGVPGAFMSMLGIAFLNEIVSKSSVKTSGQVLDNLRQSVISSLHQTGKEGEAQDGMDISLVVYNYETKIVQFSGANNPLYIIRSNDKAIVEQADKTVEGETHTLYEIKGDKMPIGIYKKELTDFATVEIQLLEGDQMYMFSDGYADQFGGPKGKKLKYKPFKGLLLEHTEKPMSEQREILNNYFEDWRGMHEQIDDVIVMGIKV